MRKTTDALTRARQALSQVDGELDLARTRSEALARARSVPVTFDADDTDDTAVPGVEILRHGQRPELPRRRTRIWALAAALALLGGAGAGAAALWPEPGQTMPGAPASRFPEPDEPTTAPETTPTSEPRECVSAKPVPTPKSPGSPSPGSAQTDGCDTVPSPSLAPDVPGRPTDSATR